MKTDIILSGVGGQGILSIAAVIAHAALIKGLNIKQAEVHGMSQRGGDVQSNLRLSDLPIASDIIPSGKAGLIISLEPMESLRYLPMLSLRGWVVTSVKPLVNIPAYPPVERISEALSALPHKVLIDAEGLAGEAGSVRAANMVVLGAAIPFTGIDLATMEEGVRGVLGRKGEDALRINISALRAGYNQSTQIIGQQQYENN
ncbi:MAG: indolepyruvate oxidoreductase subunit beta [Tannerellaceae bacterium]|jgi:indolepyruvate ferredoxin oxidoreductase beta subunit|nr:indolepyruvate oxidoreductase subunit beta [Tannerellaceae bacterium]